MALTATMRRFDVALADADRGVYADLALRVAQHPSESERFLVARVVARCLEHDEGVDFGRGLSTDDEPALHRHDLRGDRLAWIDVGSPSVERLHKASKLAPRVAVYTWKDAARLAASIAEARVHRAEEIVVVALDAAFLDAVAATLDKSNRWELSVSGATLYLTVSGRLFEGRAERAVRGG